MVQPDKLYVLVKLLIEKGIIKDWQEIEDFRVKIMKEMPENKREYRFKEML